MDRKARGNNSERELRGYRDDIRRAERNEIRSKWLVVISATALVVMLVTL